MDKNLQKNIKKPKHRRSLVRVLVSLAILVLLLDVLFLLYGGEYLAKQIIPPLPTNGVVIECFSQHTVLCKNINYTTNYTPQEILSQWSTPIYQNENLQGNIIYHSKMCNESWLGLHYASFHKRQEGACATMYAWNEGSSKITQVGIQISWSVCRYVVDEYLNQTMDWYFHCSE